MREKLKVAYLMFCAIKFEYIHYSDVHSHILIKVAVMLKNDFIKMRALSYKFCSKKMFGEKYVLPSINISYKNLI